MRRRLLLSLIVAITASLGAECDGSSSGDTATDGSTSQTVVTQTPGPASPTPEPGAALVFGAGLLTAWVVTRRRSR
jgi:hypothetical protein